MIRFVLRFVGLLLLALAFIFVVYDGMKSIADRDIYLTKIGQFWIDIHGASEKVFEDAVGGLLGSGVWQLAIQPVLDQPASAFFAVLGVALIILGRKKRPLIGYARD